MASALTVHDVLHSFWAHRHRQEALAGRGPVANAVLRRPQPRPETYYLPRPGPPGRGPDPLAEMPLQDDGLEEVEDLEIWSAPSGLTMSADHRMMWQENLPQIILRKEWPTELECHRNRALGHLEGQRCQRLARSLMQLHSESGLWAVLRA